MTAACFPGRSSRPGSSDAGDNGPNVMRPFLEWLTVVAGTLLVGAGLGRWASRDALRSWYPRLRKPALNPPAAVFPVV